MRVTQAERIRRDSGHRLACAAVVTAGILVVAPRCEAGSCPSPADAPALADVDVEARLAFLARAFDREVGDVDLWSWTWGSIYVGAAIAQGVIVPLVHDYGTRVDLTVGSISAAFGAVSLFALPLEITLPLRAARRDWSDTRRCRLLGEAEATLFHVDKQQQLSTGWVPHVGNVAFNAGLAVVLGWGYGRWKSAAISAGIGTAVGEANVLTQPHHLAQVIERYRAGQLDEHGGHSVSWSIAPLPVAGAGVSLRIDF